MMEDCKLIATPLLSKWERNISVDIVRIIACFLVILYHSRYEFIIDNALDKYISFGAFFFGRLAVPLFFIISGYLILPISIDTISFLKKKVKYIMIPLVFWLMLYTLLFSNNDGNVLYSMFTLKFSPHLWYLYAYIGMILLIPIVSAYLNKCNVKELTLYVLVWGITLFFNKNFFNNFPSLAFDHLGFQFANNPLMSLINFYGYFGYFLLGTMAKKVKFRIYDILFLFIFGVAILIIAMVFFNIEMNNAMAYLSLPAVLISYSIFLIVTRIKFMFSERIKDVIVGISKLTLGIYLVHWALLQYLYEIIGTNINIIIISIITFLLSLILIFLISKLPFSKYLIGQ